MSNTSHAVSSHTFPAEEGRQWLQRQASLDWQAKGLPEFDAWDEAIATVARLVACSTAPMALMLGPEGHLVVSQSVERLLAPTYGASVIGQSILQVLPRMALATSSLLQRVTTGQSLSLRKQRIKLKSDGKVRPHWFNLEFTPVPGAPEEMHAVLGIATDITPLVAQIRNLSASEKRLTLALEGSGMVGIWALEVATNRSTADANVARMYNLPVKECEQGIDDDRFINAIHPEDREGVQASLTHAIENNIPYRSRYRLANSDGRIRWVVTSATPTCDRPGNVTHMLGVVVEVTEQVEAASALAESRFQFQTLTETLPQIVWSSDAEGRHDYFSARWSEFTGIRPEDITEETWKHLVYPEHQVRVAEVWGKAMRTGEAYDIDYRFRHHSGEYRWLRVMAHPIRDAEGKIIRWFGTSTDVHQAYLIAEEREQLSKALERIATEDPLTGVFTRRAFTDRSSSHLEQDSDAKHQSSLLMLDVDYFKAINDTYGHPVGDKVLAAVSERIRNAVRQQDLIGRMGGEEFAVFFPRCTLSRAVEIAERICRAVAQHPITTPEGHFVNATVSIGVISIEDKTKNLDQMLTAADRVLYKAKAEGRNRVLFRTI